MSTIDACKSLVQEAFSSPSKWEGNLTRAEALLSAAILREPASTLLLTCLGAVLCDQAQHEKAVTVLSRAAALGSTDRNTFFNLGVAVLQSGSHEEAMRFFSKARALQPSPQSWEAYFDPQAH